MTQVQRSLRHSGQTSRTRLFARQRIEAEHLRSNLDFGLRAARSLRQFFFKLFPNSAHDLKLGPCKPEFICPCVGHV